MGCSFYTRTFSVFLLFSIRDRIEVIIYLISLDDFNYNINMKDFERRVEHTADGSITLYIPEMDEHYHSTNGAIIEALHVYVDAAFKNRLSRGQEQCLSILEVGFGTGLNAFLTMLEAERSERNVSYTTLELFPLSEDITSQLNYAEQVALMMGGDVAKLRLLFDEIHNASWNVTVEITPYFTLEKRKLDLTKDTLKGNFDIVYYDAFAPDKQADMWTDEVVKKVCGRVNKGGVLTTYCAKGVVRRGFRDQGFLMERLPGPPGKREMIRGTKE